MSEEEDIVTQVDKYAYNVITPALCTFGIICNLLNLVVLTRRELNRYPYVYLTALSVMDNGVLVLYLIFTAKSRRTVEGEESKIWRYYDSIAMTPIINMFSYSSILIIVLISIDRLLFVRLSGSRAATVFSKYVKLQILVICSLAVLFNIPRFFLFDVVKSSDGKYVINSTEFRESTAFYVITILQAVFVHFLSLLVVSVCNIYLVRALVKARKSARNQMTNVSSNIATRIARDEKRLTRTLIAIILLFVITVTPSAFSSRPIAFALYHGDYTWDGFVDNPAYGIFRTVANVLVILNCSLNFVLYCGFNRIFTETLKALFVRQFRRVQHILKLGNLRTSQECVSTNEETQTLS